jgi:RimJ/RimL family protein N-acetyltransferase
MVPAGGRLDVPSATDVSGYAESVNDGFERQSLRSERIFLRPVEPEDVDLIHGWHEDIEVRRLGGSPVRGRAESRRRFEELQREVGKEVFSFMICLIADGRPIGRVDLFHISRLNGSAALGIEIGEREMWSRGYGTEAVNALVDFAFGELRLERVWLGTAANNPRAHRAYRKCGFVVEARQRNAYFERGEFVDEIVMSILRDEWRALTRKRSWDYAPVD